MAEQKVVATTGNTMVAEAFRQCAPDVVPAYPITPQTTIVEEFAKFVAQGRVHTEYVTVESEHSAMSACVGASAAGARVMTATSSQGLAYMWEELHIAAGMRLPIVMANANRALSAPINIHCDHSDIMGARDTGWIIYFAETAQEAYDNTIMALRIAEHPDVMLPVMTTLDGFITTHSIDRAELMDDEAVKAFVGDYKPENALLDVENPVSHGNFAGLGGPYFEFKKSQRNAIEPLHGRHQGGRRRVVRALRPPLRRRRGLGHGGRRVRHRRHRLHRRQRTPRGPRAARRGREGGRAQGPRASGRSRSPRSPTHSRTSRPSPCSTAPSRSAPRADRSSSRFAARSMTSSVRPAIVNYIYGLGGADVQARAHRGASTATWSTSPPA